MANVLVRIQEAALHDAARIGAAARKQSLNAYIVAALRAQVMGDARLERRGPVAAVLECAALAPRRKMATEK